MLLVNSTYDSRIILYKIIIAVMVCYELKNSDTLLRTYTYLIFKYIARRNKKESLHILY